MIRIALTLHFRMPWSLVPQSSSGMLSIFYQCVSPAELQALQCSLTSEQIASKTAELQSQVAPICILGH